MDLGFKMTKRGGGDQQRVNAITKGTNKLNNRSPYVNKQPNISSIC